MSVESAAASKPCALDGVSLRPAEPDDVDIGLLDVLNQVSAAGTQGLTRDRGARLIAEMRAREVERTWVALRQGRAIGAATLIVEQKLIHGGSRAGRIEDVVVDREFRRKGIGRMLIRRLCELGAELDCYKIVLGCDPRSVGFYEKCGFHLHDVGMRIDLAPR